MSMAPKKNPPPPGENPGPKFSSAIDAYKSKKIFTVPPTEAPLEPEPVDQSTSERNSISLLGVSSGGHDGSRPLNLCEEDGDGFFDAGPSDTDLIHMQELHNRWARNDPGRPNMDWRAALEKPLQEQNIDQIKAAGMIGAQFKINELAHEADSEAIQLQAAQYILAQNGHGPITRTETKIEFDKIPKEQLLAIIGSKLASLRRLCPDFDFAPILNQSMSQPIEIEAEETL